MSEAHPLLAPPSPPAAQRARAPAVRGVFTPGKPTPAQVHRGRQDGRDVYTAPDLHIDVDGARCSVAQDASSLTISFGGDAAAARTALRAGDAQRCNGGVVHIDLEGQRLSLITDRFSIFPLCFWSDGTSIALSDRADAVPLSGPRTLDLQAIYNYLYFHVIPAPRTIFAGVSRLEPSMLLEFDAGGIRQRRIWQPRFAERAAADLKRLSKDFVELVRDAVKTRSTDTTGCFLSGGTDSSTVAGMLARQRGGTADAFSIGFDAEGYDEMAYARIAARHFGLRHHEYYVTPTDLVRAMPGVAGHFDQPFGNSSAVPAHYCALLAREHGISRLLAGDGGDELFGGNSRYAKQRVFDLYATVPEALRRAVIEPALQTDAANALPLVRKAASYVRQARQPMPDRAAAYNLLEHIGAERLLARTFLAQIDATEPLGLQRRVYQACDARSPLNRELAYDWRFTLADNDLPKVVGSSALAGVQTAFPLLDDTIVDLSLQLPPSQKVRGLQLRYFFKQALADFLPGEILRKKKHGFGLPFGVWLARDATLRGFGRQTVEALAGRGLVRHGVPAEVFDTLLPQHPKFYGEVVWILVMLECWLQQHAPETRIA